MSRLLLVRIVIVLTCAYTVAGWGSSPALVYRSYLKAVNSRAGAGYGGTVAMSGDTLVVGASGEASASSGVNGDDSDSSQPETGAVYVYIRHGNSWVQQAYLKASNPDSGDYFGHSVAIDGDTIVVGALLERSNATGVNGNQNDNSLLYKGAAYVFVRNGNNWTQQAYLKGDNQSWPSYFGDSVAIQGDTVVVGATGESDATSGEIDPMDTSGGGRVYVFKRNGGTWTKEARIKGSNTEAYDNFGRSVAISGDTIVVGADSEMSNARVINGDESNNDLAQAGAAYVFKRAGGSWEQEAYLKAHNTDAQDLFGTSVALSGNTAVVGAVWENGGIGGVNGNGADNSVISAGAAYVYVRTGSTWSFQAYLKSPVPKFSDFFGQAVKISGNIIAVGAVYDSSDAAGIDGDAANELARNSGAACMYAREGTTWKQIAYIKAPNTGVSDAFGCSLAMTETVLAIGAPQESSAARGLDGDMLDDSATNAGAAYLYSISRPMLDLQNTKNLGDGSFILNYTSAFGADFSVLANDDLSNDAGWTVLGRVQKQSEGKYQFIDSSASGQTKRFYKLRNE